MRRVFSPLSAIPTSEPDREVSRHRTMALFGTRFDDPARYAAPLRKDEPDCHLVFINDAGHAITNERPDAFTE